LIISLVCTLAGSFAHLVDDRAKRLAGKAADTDRPWRWWSPLKEYLPVSFGGAVISFLLLGLLGLKDRMRWGGAVAALPSLLVLLQYVYVWAHKPGDTNGEPANDLEDESQRAARAVESTYGPRTLFIRYGFPAIVLLMEGIVLVFVLVEPDTFFGLPKEILRGATYGAAGAYAWVVLELGRRSFRRDVTGGIALWSIVTLALGPILAGVITLIWKPNLEGDTAWQAATVLFYAGYAPRKVLTVMSAAAGQLLGISQSPNVETRTTPLTKIRGIDAQIEERLAEEGIHNVETLATVEPIRLLRDTSFDLRAILWWIDEALLMMYLPQRWQLLEEQGITGAIDVADLVDKDGTLSANPVDKSTMKALAEHIRMDPDVFGALAQRIRYDKQVTYVWWLYNRYVADGYQPTQKAPRPQPA
jgi:hypothetical protein